MAVDVIGKIGLSFLQLLLSLVMMVVSLYIGYSLFARVTKIVNGFEEIKKGNPAIGIVIASFFIAMGIIIQSGLAGISSGVGKAIVFGVITPPALMVLGISLLQLIIAIIIAVFAIYVSLRIFDSLTKDIREFEELKNGNIAVALELAGIILTVSIILQSGINGITATLF